MLMEELNTEADHSTAFEVANLQENLPNNLKVQSLERLSLVLHLKSFVLSGKQILCALPEFDLFHPGSIFIITT